MALKIVRHDGDVTSAKLLAKEAKVLADLDHPGIVRVFDHGEVDGLSFMAMELLEGVNLEQHLDELKGNDASSEDQVDRGAATMALGRSSADTIALPFVVHQDLGPGAATATRGQLAPVALRRIDHVLWTLETASQICDALGTVHAAGVLHRDLKPANIMLVEGRGAVITDFGTVHAPSRATFTMAAALVGTPAYMSPEQADERTLDQRSDLYSLGATIYHCIAGRPPFAERSLTAVLRALDRSEPAALRKINPALPPDFAKVLAKAMAKDARDRFASAGEFGEALDRVRRGAKLGRLWSIPGIYRRTRRWRLPVSVTLAVALTAWFWTSPNARIHALIVDGRLQAAVDAMDALDQEGRGRVMADLRVEIPPTHTENLEKIIAVVKEKALVHVPKSQRFQAAIGSTDKWFQTQKGDLPKSFVNLSEEGAFLQARPEHNYLYLLDQDHEFSDGSPRVYYVPLELDKQTLDGPLSHECNLELLPRRPFRSEFRLDDPTGGWVAFEPDSYTVLKAKGRTANIKLTSPLIVHKFEVPRSAVNYYHQWCKEDPERQALFAHPNEGEELGIMAEVGTIAHQSGRGSYPAEVTYWAAFRVTGFLGCRMPIADEWLLAAQDGKQNTMPAGPSSYSKDSNRERIVDWKITEPWDHTELGIWNMHSYPAEWTTTPATNLRASIRPTMWCFFESRFRDSSLPFTPNRWDSAILSIRNSPKDQRGLRLFRDRFLSPPR